MTDVPTHRRREADVDPDPHDPATCPTCRQRTLDEEELRAAYGLRTCPICGLAPAVDGSRYCSDCRREAGGLIL